MVVAKAKKHTFVGALNFHLDLAAKSQPSKASNCVEQKLLTLKDTLELAATQSHHCLGAKPLCQPVRLTNCKYYPRTNHKDSSQKSNSNG